MGISDHLGKTKTFSSDCLVTEKKTHKKNHIENAANFLNFLREIKDHFSQVDVLFNAFTLSPLNGVSSRFFLNHIDKWKLIYEFQHIQKNNVEWNIFMALEHELKDKI